MGSLSAGVSSAFGTIRCKMLFLLCLADRTTSYALILATVLLSAESVHASPSLPTPTISFARNSAAPDWIPINPDTRSGIFVHASVNGHPGLVGLYTGLSTRISKDFAHSIAAKPAVGTDNDAVGGLTIEIGNLTLSGAGAHLAEIPGVLAQREGGPVLLQLGDELFEHVAVEVDLSHHRVAFLDPAHLSQPAGAATVPLKRTGDDRTLSLSIEGAPSGQFALWTGNPGYLLVYQHYYEANRLDQRRKTSQRLMPGGVEGTTTVRDVVLGDVRYKAMPAALVPDSVSKVDSSILSGGITLTMLTPFQAIIDYPANLLYLTSVARPNEKDFSKDRLGFVVTKLESIGTVAFVSPGSPAERSGLHKGDNIAAINGKAVRDWSALALADLRFAPSGTAVTYALANGTHRRLVAKDYY